MPSWSVRALGAVVLALVGAAGGALLYGRYLEAQHGAEVAQMRRTYAVAVADARAADVRALQAAQARADALTVRLQKTQARLDQKSKEVRDALQSQTSGRECLSAGAVRLLNDAIATDGAADLPQASPSIAATDGSVATDTDVSAWANTARAQFAICRARLDALIDFFAD